MKPETQALASRIADEPVLDQFLLVGGTALSIHLEHRLSEDLDFAMAPARESGHGGRKDVLTQSYAKKLAPKMGVVYN